MKKVFPLKSGGHKPARVIESIKSDVRKYVKRERRKDLPEGVDYWDFDCRVGRNAESAAEAHVSTINAAIDAAALEGVESIYIEVLRKPATRGQNQGA